MINLLSIVALGFFLGMRHATDPDHVIAVTTVVSRQTSIRRSALVGAIWGLGHSLTIFIVGSGIILFDLVIPPRVGLSVEFCVAVMLVVLGVMNIRSFVRSIPAPPTSGSVHSHAHSHGDYVHTHPHGHEPETHPHSAKNTPVARLDRTLGKINFYQHLRPLAIGVVHGLAGSAAVALLVLATIRDPRWAVVYLLVFGTGTIAGMVLVTLSIASTFRLFGESHRFFRRLALASGFLSLGFGLIVAFQVCVRNGLLSAAPHWTPR